MVKTVPSALHWQHRFDFAGASIISFWVSMIVVTSMIRNVLVVLRAGDLDLHSWTSFDSIPSYLGNSSLLIIFFSPQESLYGP